MKGKGIYNWGILGQHHRAAYANSHRLAVHSDPFSNRTTGIVYEAMALHVSG